MVYTSRDLICSIALFRYFTSAFKKSEWEWTHLLPSPLVPFLSFAMSWRDSFFSKCEGSPLNVDLWTTGESYGGKTFSAQGPYSLLENFSETINQCVESEAKASRALNVVPHPCSIAEMCREALCCENYPLNLWGVVLVRRWRTIILALFPPSMLIIHRTKKPA